MIPKPGEARSPGQSYQEIIRLEAKTQAVPPVLLEEHFEYQGSDDIPISKYLDPGFAKKEVATVWRKTWQMACRLEDIPNVGDHVLYEVADQSLVVIRSAEDDIRAYYNACLHRGRQLRDVDGTVPFLRCPFHGWTWNLDGTLKTLPSEWDFPHVDKDKFCLPQAKVETWGGFVFLNMDQDAPPLSEYLGVLPEHFNAWPLEKRHKVAHVAKIVEANWKVALEAFIEGYHGMATHPQMAFYVADENSQYDHWGPNVSRLITAQDVPTPNLADSLDEQTIARAQSRDLGIGDPDAIVVPEGSTAREVMCNVVREQLKMMAGLDLSEASDAEVIDAIQYFVFPNFFPWAGYGVPYIYRFRPFGTDPNRCVVDVMMLLELPEGLPKPPAPKMRWLESDDWRDAPELGLLSNILNQDMQNMANVQRGMRQAHKQTITLSNYQESRIRHFHRTLDAYTGI